MGSPCLTMMRTTILLSAISVSLAINDPQKCNPYKNLKAFNVHLASKWKTPKILAKTGAETNEEKFAKAKQSSDQYEAKQQIWKDLKGIVTQWVRSEVGPTYDSKEITFLLRVENRLFTDMNDPYKTLRNPFNYQSYCELLNTIEQECETLIGKNVEDKSPLEKFIGDWQTLKCGTGSGSWDCQIKVDPNVLINDQISDQLGSIADILTQNPIPVSKTAGLGIATIKLAHPEKSKTVGPWMIKVPRTAYRLAASLDRANHLKPDKAKKATANLKEEDFNDKPTRLFFDHIIAAH